MAKKRSKASLGPTLGYYFFSFLEDRLRGASGGRAGLPDGFMIKKPWANVPEIGGQGSQVV